MSKTVVKAAKAWAGKDFKPGVGEQCMAFVRQVLHDAKSPVQDVVSKAPVDGLETSYYLASSLAGRDVGQLVDKVAGLSPGSVVFFQNTYGEWPAGTITHVGVYVGDGRMVHRPTMARPVEEVALTPDSYWGSLFRCGILLPDAVAATPAKPAPPQPKKLKIFAHSGKVKVIQDDKETSSAAVVLDVHDGKLGVRVNGVTVLAPSVELLVTW